MVPLNCFEISQVNYFLAQKQHLLPGAKLTDPVQVTRDIVALHATGAAGPYLSLWARLAGFQRQTLENSLYSQRELVRSLCMRTTLHLVPSDDMPFFHQAYLQKRSPIELRDTERLLVQAGLCTDTRATTLLKDLHGQVLDVLADMGPSTVREISLVVPELQAKVGYSVDKSYGGEFSVGSRLVPSMCALGILVRARTRGTWRSNLHAYAPITEWLPHVNLNRVSPDQARVWLVRRYVSAFGPVTLDDVQWWTGFSRREAEEALADLKSDLEKVAIKDMDAEYLMRVEDAQRLCNLTPLTEPSTYFLPSLDPYIMGYRDRRRFLAAQHSEKVFDRAGNAMPTVWVDGQVVGVWVQNKSGSVLIGLFEKVANETMTLLERRRTELERFLEGEYLPQRTHTPFSRALV